VKAAIDAALELDEAMGDQENLAGSETDLSTVYLSLGDLTLAEASFKHALALNQARGRKAAIADDYTTWGYSMWRAETRRAPMSC
jgi:Tfp pilus assembly protein PilF